MTFRWLLVLLMPAAFCGEVRTMSLRQVLDAAVVQNPEVALARLEEEKSNDDIVLAKDPFHPKLVIGSGIAYSSGFPMSIDGSAPAILQAKAIASIFDRPQSYRVNAAKERRKMTDLDTQSKREEIAHRAASLFLDAQRLQQAIRVVKSQVENLVQVERSVKVRVDEGREIPLELKRTQLRLRQASQRVKMLEAEAANATISLAALLGMDVGDRVQPLEAELQMPAAHLESEELAVDAALSASKEVKRLEIALLAKGWEVKAGQAANLPKIDLVAQYALLTKYNHYEDYYRSFQRHNGQLGISIQLPVLTGSASRAMASQASLEINRLRLQMATMRNRISLDVRRAWQDVDRAQTTTELSRLELDVQRDEVTRILALIAEGRSTQKQLEEARYLENEKWVSMFDSRYSLERARLELLRQTGTLLAQLH